MLSKMITKNNELEVVKWERNLCKSPKSKKC